MGLAQISKPACVSYLYIISSVLHCQPMYCVIGIGIGILFYVGTPLA